MTRARIALGIDVGGSKTHALASKDGDVVLDHTTGSANLQSIDHALVGQRLDEIFSRLGAHHIRSVYIGAAGADSERQISFLEHMVRSRTPEARIAIAHDTELLLPAAGKEHGIALLSGTGSVAYGVADDRRTARAGGWGYLLGDEGSGFWIFREAVRHTLQASDRGEAHDELSRALLADCACRHAIELLDHAYAYQEREIWAKRAELVLGLAESKVASAVRIREQAADALTGLAETVRSRLDGTLGVVLAGGLLTHAGSLQSRVRGRLAEAGFTEVSVLDKPPAYGALVLAERLL